MQSTFDIVADIIARECHVPREVIEPDSNLLNDLGIDSLDLLQVRFCVDEAFGVRVPVEQWLHGVHLKAIRAEQHFVMHEFCARIDALVTAATG